MFHIEICRSVIIEGCPQDGLPAFDFRRANGLPDGTSNRISLRIDVTDEPTARALSDFLDGDADINWQGNWTVKQRFSAGDYRPNPKTEDHMMTSSDPEITVPASLAVRLLAGELPAILELAEAYRAVRAVAQASYDADKASYLAQETAQVEAIRRITEARELLAGELADLRQDRDDAIARIETVAQFLAHVPDDALRGTLKLMAHSSEAITALRQKIEDASPYRIFEDEDDE